jgi:hypothetical protein
VVIGLSAAIAGADKESGHNVAARTATIGRTDLPMNISFVKAGQADSEAMLPPKSVIDEIE